VAGSRGGKEGSGGKEGVVERVTGGVAMGVHWSDGVEGEGACHVADWSENPPRARGS